MTLGIGVCTEAGPLFKVWKTCRSKTDAIFPSQTAFPLDRACKCGGGTYIVPQLDDVPLLLRNLSSEDIRVLRPFDIHCGDYKRVVHGYRQRTGPFRITWSSLRVQEKIEAVGDATRRRKLQLVFNFLMAKRDCKLQICTDAAQRCQATLHF